MSLSDVLKPIIPQPSKSLAFGNTGPAGEDGGLRQKFVYSARHRDIGDGRYLCTLPDSISDDEIRKLFHDATPPPQSAADYPEECQIALRGLLCGFEMGVLAARRQIEELFAAMNGGKG